MRVEPWDDPEDELDGLCRNNVFPMFAVSKAVVDLETMRLAKYSSGLVLRPTYMLAEGVRARDCPGDFAGSLYVLRLPEVRER